MDTKIKLKKNLGISIPIVMFVLLGLTVSMAIIARIDKSSDSIIYAYTKKNQIVSYDTSQVGIAISWLEKNKENLNNDRVEVFDSYALKYSSNGYVGTEETNSLGKDIFKAYDEVSVGIGASKTDNTIWSTSTLGVKVGLELPTGFSSSILIYRMCKLQNAVPNEIVNGVENKCVTDPVLMSPISSNNSSVGYGGYDYTVSPDSNKIIYLIKVYSAEKQSGTKDNVTLETETMVSM